MCVLLRAVGYVLVVFSWCVLFVVRCCFGVVVGVVVGVGDVGIGVGVVVCGSVGDGVVDCGGECCSCWC